MTLMDKVGKGIVVLGLAGITASTGTFLYSVSNTNQHPRLVEIVDESVKLVENYGECVLQSSDETNCNDMREKYLSLLKEEVTIRTSAEYKQLQENNQHYQNLALAGAFGMPAFFLLAYGGIGLSKLDEYLARREADKDAGRINKESEEKNKP